MKKYVENKLTEQDRFALLQRSSQFQNETEAAVKQLCSDIKQRGDAAVYEYSLKFDKANIRTLRVSAEEFESAKRSVSPEFLDAAAAAAGNIRKFHESQKCNSQKIETMKGVTCWREPRPIENVGLYIPAGSAPLPSTVLMLGIPAKIAGCKRIVLCSPPKKDNSINDFVLAAASIVGIDEIYKVGGAQAVAAMAYGTETIPKVDKIFGPGNRFVTAAKQFVSADPGGAQIDLLAGPSEVLVIADESADPDVVAYDLISQCEHDADAQAVLVTVSKKLADEIMHILPSRAGEFPRNNCISASLERSFIVIADSLESAVRFSNDYAPEHLIINTHNAERLAQSVTSAGSVFIGPFAPVTAGDYASGTNHTLPTNGAARFTGGVSLDSYQKYITFQLIDKAGLAVLAPVLTAFAETEGLQAHARAVTSRLSSK
ncbi:MAG: histidinol dehydrogenase [Bacteroidetes bacterium]|nr:histidinol dehydrogenase [Bacteroidota bacterium]